MSKGPRSLKIRERPESRINGLPQIRYNQNFLTIAYSVL